MAESERGGARNLSIDRPNHHLLGEKKEKGASANFYLLWWRRKKKKGKAWLRCTLGGGGSTTMPLSSASFRVLRCTKKRGGKRKCGADAGWKKRVGHGLPYPFTFLLSWRKREREGIWNCYLGKKRKRKGEPGPPLFLRGKAQRKKKEGEAARTLP